MKKLVNLKGVVQLTKATQKSIKGGACVPGNECAGQPAHSICYLGCDKGNVGECVEVGGGVVCAPY